MTGAPTVLVLPGPEDSGPPLILDALRETVRRRRG
jgi:hypothetical protein